MEIYKDLLRKVLADGKPKADRTGEGTISIFGHQIRIDLNEGFPLLTTKKVHLPSIIHELLWFLKGDTNNAYLKQNGVRIWNEWADENGDLGPIYGKQWRSWTGFDGKVYDQIKDVVEQIKINPLSRRLIVSAWKVDEINKMKLPPCHCLFQFYVIDDTLSCQLYQRSADLFLGVPFNIASYSLLTMMIAQVCNLKIGHFVHSFGDLHLYDNHVEKAKTQLKREPYPLPTIKINKERKDIFSFQYDDFEIIDYKHHPKINAKVAV